MEFYVQGQCTTPKQVKREAANNEQSPSLDSPTNKLFGIYATIAKDVFKAPFQMEMNV